MTKQHKLYMLPYLLWMILFVVTPLGLVLSRSFCDLEGHFTLENFRRFLTPVYLKMTFDSFSYALLITIFSLLVAYPTAYFLSRTKHKHLWLLLIIVPSWINLLLKTYAFIGIFSAHGVVNSTFDFLGLGIRQLLFTDFSFIFVSVYIFIPFMILPIFNAIEELHPSLVYAARDLGASSWQTFRLVIFPLTLHGVKAGCQIIFIPALSLFMITRLIAGNRIITLGTAIEQHFLVTEDWGMGSAIAVVLILIMWGIMVITRNRSTSNKGSLS